MRVLDAELEYLQFPYRHGLQRRVTTDLLSLQP